MTPKRASQTAAQARMAARLSATLNKLLSDYAAAAAAAGVSGLALVQPADAKIVYTPAHTVIHPSHPVRLDLNHDGVKDFVLQQMSTHTTNFVFSSLAVDTLTKNKVVGNAAGAAALKPGFQVSSGKSFEYGLVPMAAVRCTSGFTSCTFTGPWAGGGNGVKNRYLGLQFVIKGSTHYGWARLNVAYGPKATLTGYAYETIANKPIITGKTKGPDEVTVPATLGHLARGTSAMQAWRSKAAVLPTGQP